MDVDPKFPSGLGKIRIMHKGIDRKILQALDHGKACTLQKSRRNRDPSTIYLQPPISPTTSASLFNSMSFSFIVTEDFMSALCDNDLGTSYHVIERAQIMISNAD